MSLSIPLIPATPELHQAATILSTAFQLPLLDSPAAVTSSPLMLYLTSEHLELRALQNHLSPIYADFIKGHLGYRRYHGGGRKQPLAKAVGLKHGATPTVIDATAGLGRDGFILATLGCQVTLLERSPIIAALLHDGLQRAYQEPDLGHWLPSRLHLVHQDASHYLSQLALSQWPAVIYLDPMYPPRQKSALVKKEMRIFRTIVGEDTDANDLLEIALTQARHRVVVKRPQGAPTLNERIPNFTVESENTRFDVYMINSAYA